MDRRKRHMRNPSNPKTALCGNKGDQLKFTRPGNNHRVTCQACLRELAWQENAFPGES